MDLDKIATHPLQTSAWRDFRRQWGNEILETKYGLLTLHKLPFINKKIAMFIRGPKPSKAMLDDLKVIAKKNNIIFIKLEPNVTFSDSSKQKVASSKEKDKLIAFLKKNGAVPGKTLFTPTTFWIDTSGSLEEIMKSFKSKTRYNIRYAHRKGVEVTEDNSDQAFDRYIDLMRETVERQRFYAHSERYHRLMWKLLQKAGIASLLVARYKGEIHTAWIVFKWRDKLYYPYGASTHKHKNIQANSAMMWGAINFAKKHNLAIFDLWGREEGKGFTRFKEGFSPEVIEFLGTWDLVIDKNLYKFYRLAEKLRWAILRAKAIRQKPSF